MNINCLVIDDEELARKLLENYIGRLPNLTLVGQCKNPIEAIQVLQSELVDLLFLDIQMPGLTGIEFLRTLKHKPQVVLTTAYAEYAVEGYSLDVTDYLLKPFSFERFMQAVNKVTEVLSLKSLAGNGKDEKDKEVILVKSEHKIHRMKLDDIRFIQSMREYVAYYLPSGRILSLNSLKQLEAELPSDRFIRIHKSYIVAIDKVETLEGNMLHIGKDKLPIGASYREAVVGRIFK